MDDVPADSEWLGRRERRFEATLTMEHRRRDWRAGRWAAKALALRLAANDWEVIADEDGGPRVWWGEQVLPNPISISHRGEFAAAVLSVDERPVGIDLELVEMRSERFVRDYFAPAEAERAARLPANRWDLYASAVWSAKEAVLKCLRLGLNRDTRSVVVDLDVSAPAAHDGGWSPFIGYDRPTGQRYRGWWTHHTAACSSMTNASGGGLVVTIAEGPPRV